MFHFIILSFLILGETDAGYLPSNGPSIEDNAGEIALLRAEMKAENAKLWKELKETKEELQKQKERCACEPDRTGDNKEEKRLLDNTDVLHQVQVDIQNLKSDVVSLQSLRTNVSNLQNQMIAMNHPRIGFTAVLSKKVSNLGDNQLIVFDLIHTNLGNDYNHQTGVFTCEVPGMYVFYVHTLAEPGKHLETSILKNLYIIAYTYAFDKEYYSSGSNMAVVTLAKGDTVLVRSNEHEHDHDGAIIDYMYTSFSGFLFN